MRRVPAASARAGRGRNVLAEWLGLRQGATNRGLDRVGGWTGCLLVVERPKGQRGRKALGFLRTFARRPA